MADSQVTRSRLPAALLVLLAAGLGLRLFLAYIVFPGEGLGSDLRLFGSWAQTLNDHGPGRFYTYAGFADYPPGFLYVLWLMGIAGNAIANLTGQLPADAIGSLVKLPAILADVAIAFLLYRTATRWRDRRAGLIVAALFLFIPVTWYDSAVWGQIDAVGALLILVAILLVIGGWSEPAVMVAVLATATKPQYAIGLLVIGAILLRRHLLRAGSGPVPQLGPRLSAVDRRLGGLFTRRQGPIRLLSSAVLGAAVGIAVILPFDLAQQGPVSLWEVPIVGHLAGLLAVVGSGVELYEVLTANAFNPWAIVGPNPLSEAINTDIPWTFDSLAVIGSLPAMTVGAILLLAVAGLIVIGLLQRDDRVMIVLAMTAMAVAFFVLPTRVHERYLFPAFAIGALLAASSARWRWWYVLLGLANAANLHAVLTQPRDGYGTPAIQALPFGELLREPWAVTLVALAHLALFAWVLVAFLAAVPWGRTREPLPEPAVADLVPAPALAASPAVSDDGRRWYWPVTAFLAFVTRPFRTRLNRPSEAADTSAERATEPGGRLDLVDLAAVLILVLVTLGARTYRLETPSNQYFDEDFHARTAMEFLQEWRYGIPHELWETTHPHVAKYLIAAGIAVFGNNAVTSTAAAGATPLDAAIEPAFADRAADGGLGGDRIALATGSGVRIGAHGDVVGSSEVPLAGATAVAFDETSRRLFVGTDAGEIWVLDQAALEAAEQGLEARPIRLGEVTGSIRDLWIAGAGVVLVDTDRDDLIAFDVLTRSIAASEPVSELAGVAPLGDYGNGLVALAGGDGITIVDPTTLQEVGRLELPAQALGIAFVEGGDWERRNRDMLAVPTLYVATDGFRVETIEVGDGGVMTPSASVPMPGPISDLRWNYRSNMVHVLGRSPDGAPTLYVLNPDGNSVFADAELPFEPETWVLDAQDHAPDLDRHRALVFGNGEMATVEIGGNSFAWRFPGVVAGALMAGLMYLLARLLFERRSVAILLAVMIPLEGLLFAQSRIAMNDAFVGLFIVAAFTLLAALLRRPSSGLVTALIGLPLIGILLGLGLGSKWVAAYAMGGAALIVLLRSRIGRWIALAGMVVLTGVLGYQAAASQPPNLLFVLLMFELTALLGLAIVRIDRVRPEPDEGSVVPDWADPTRLFGLRIGWALVCLLVIPLVVYVATYVPWALSAGGDPQLVSGWPPGHTGQTFLALQDEMYRYHNELRFPHGASSPWWAWPLGLKPIWGYYEVFVDGTEALLMGDGNPVLLWMAIPAVAWGVWAAWKRRSASLLFLLIAFAVMWLPWARIDRVAYNYHYYTALPFALALLAYFLAELWDGPAARTWKLARISFAVVLAGPALLWLLRDPLCVVGGATTMDPTSFACTRSMDDILAPIIGWLIAAAVIGWWVLGWRRPRWLVGAVIGLAAVVFLVLYPALAAWPLPTGWPFVYQGLLPSWEGTFLFGSNPNPVVVVPLVGFGSLALTGIVVVVLGALIVAMTRVLGFERDSGRAPTEA